MDQAKTLGESNNHPCQDFIYMVSQKGQMMRKDKGLETGIADFC